MILQSSEGNKIIKYVSPIYDDSYTWLWLFEVIGRELDDLQEWTDETREQAFPQLATWAIEYFEMQYNIIPKVGTPIEERRIAIISKINSRAPMNPAKMEAMISAATGRTVKVNERTAKRTFEVEIDISDNIAPPLYMDNVVNLIDRVKPAHLLYRFIIAVYGQIQIGFILGKYIFQPPLCGTFKILDTPYMSTLGSIIQGILDVAMQKTAKIFTPPLCNNIMCGIYPITSTLGYISNGNITASVTYTSASFSPPLCNTIVCGQAA